MLEDCLPKDTRLVNNALAVDLRPASQPLHAQVSTILSRQTWFWCFVTGGTGIEIYYGWWSVIVLPNMGV